VHVDFVSIANVARCASGLAAVSSNWADTNDMAGLFSTWLILIVVLTPFHLYKRFQANWRLYQSMLAGRFSGKSALP
jgi:hypothetical protein